MPIVYNYNATTGIYSHKSEARESPLEPGVFLLPANATFEEAPKVGGDQVAAWLGDEWVVLDRPTETPAALAQPPDDLVPGLPPRFPNNPRDGDLAWSARDNGDVIKWTFHSVNNAWDEERTELSTKPYLGLEKYATQEWVKEYVEQQLAKQADSA